MKRTISLVLLTALLISVFPLNCFAASVDEEIVVTYLEDGSYIVETIYISQTRASGAKTGSKEAVYYDSNGSAEWKAVLTGTFSYTGSTATCTASSCSVTIYNSNWYVVSKTASKSGNIASADVTMGKKLLGVTVTKVTDSITLTCDKNGNLS